MHVLARQVAPTIAVSVQKHSSVGRVVDQEHTDLTVELVVEEKLFAEVLDLCGIAGLGRPVDLWERLLFQGPHNDETRAGQEEPLLGLVYMHLGSETGTLAWAVAMEATILL